MEATSRRSLLLGLIGAVTGSLAGRLAGPATVQAAESAPIVMGATNTAPAPTVLELPSTLPGPVLGPVLRVASSGDGLGVAIEAHSKEEFAIVADGVWGAIKATSPNGPGVYGSSTGGSGVIGYSQDGVGVGAGTGGAGDGATLESRQDFAVHATADRGIGVYAVTGPSAVSRRPTATNIGVHGVALDGTDARGVFGRSASGQGVRGEAASGIGVYARSTTGDGTALRVSGRAVFSSARRATIRSGASSLSVTVVGATSTSAVFATLLRDVPGTYVRAAVPSAGSVRIILNRAVSASTPVACFVVN